MTDPRPDPVDDMLVGLRVPALPADFADRVVAEAGRPGRVSALATPLPRRPHRRRWTRRGVWTAVLAINLVVASAVAAALGTGAVSAPRLIAAARHAVERLVQPRSIVVAPHQFVRPRPRPLPPQVQQVASPTEAPPSLRRPPVAPRPFLEQSPGTARPSPVIAPVVRAHAGPHSRADPGVRAREFRRGMMRPMRRERPFDRRAADRLGPERGFRAERPWPSEFDGPGLDRPRFARPGFGSPQFRGGGRFRPGRRGGRGGPRRRF